MTIQVNANLFELQLCCVHPESSDWRAALLRHLHALYTRALDTAHAHRARINTLLVDDALADSLRAMVGVYTRTFACTHTLR
jgi:hypothetical protein